MGETTLRLTDAGRKAAASCVALTLVVRSAGAAAERRLEPEREPCAAPADDLRYTPSSTAPVDPAQLTKLPFGDRSHWLQPWRAWSDTPPAARIAAAVGINFNVEPDAAPAAAKALAAYGVRRGRIEIPWNALSYDDPGQLADAERHRDILLALKAAGVRPLVLLNANHGQPGPGVEDRLTLRVAAPAGARTVRLADGEAARIRPGLTGFDAVDSDRRPDVLITAVDEAGIATLARPLPRELAAGPHPVTTLRHGPFQPPELAGGAPNPAFEATLAGWLAYTEVVTRFVNRTLGSWAFDVEIWNELSFGSDFLDAARYYDPAPQAEGDTNRAILMRTVGWLRDPANRIGPVGITDGFAGQTPFAAGSTSPPGLTALSKHPYVNPKRYPQDSGREADQRLLDATGAPEVGEPFVPSYTAYFPEYWLNAIQTETLVRDLAPQQTRIGEVAHGRTTAPAGGTPPTMWLTEFNLVAPGVDHTRPGQDGRRARTELARARAKGLLRSLVAYVHAGVTAIDFYAALGNDFGLATPDFLSSGGREPAGEPLSSLDRLSKAMVHARPRTRTRPLTVESIADVAGGRQFDGDGTAAHPPLLNREVFAALPFQLTDSEWVVPVYVMTRDVRRELEPEAYRVTLAGLPAAHTRASLYDPLTGRFEPVRVRAATGGRVTVELHATDSPRLLFLGA